MREHRSTLLEAVGSSQYGAGRPGGAKTLIHAVQVVSEARPHGAWVQLDVANAFPSVRRRAVLEALAEHAPMLQPLAETFLRRSSSFVYQGAAGRGELLRATLGVEQGDVLGPLLFAMAFRRPVERLRELLVDVLVEEYGHTKEEAEAAVVVGAYLDDVVVGLPAEAAGRVPALAAQAFAPAGCLVEQQKTKVWVPAGLCPAGCEEWWSPRGLRILGAPAEGETPLAALGELGAVVGDAGLVAGFLDQALQGYRKIVGKVVAATVESDASWSRVQTGVALLRLCALPRLLHLFRALPPAATRGFAENADAATLASYEKLLTAKLTTPAQQTQAALPTRLGGCGLLRFKELAAQAWLGSWLGTLPADRALAGPQLASSEEVNQGSAGWAGALRESVEELAAEGVHLGHTGSVGAEPPALPWSWDDSARSASSLGGGQRLRGLASSAQCPRRPEPGCGGAEVQEQGLGSWRRPLDRGRGSRTRSTGSAHACGSASPSAAGARGPGAATSAAEARPRRLPPAVRVWSA